MYSGSSKTKSNDQVSPLFHRSCHSQVRDNQYQSQKKILNQQRQQYGLQRLAKSISAKESQLHLFQNIQILDHQKRYLQKQNSIEQREINQIQQKYSKLLTNSKSTNLSSETPSNRSTIVQKDVQEEKFSESGIQDEQTQMIQKSVTAKNQKDQCTNSQNFVTLSQGLNFQKFRIIKYLNSGISGKVYLAQNTNNQCIFCIKVIAKSRIDHSQSHQLMRQIKIQSFLSHPNIVKLYQFYIDNDNIYLILEPCLGNDLYKKLKSEKNSLKQKEVKQIIRQVCQATQYMHKNDVIHRDLKPQNILIHENVVKICDFGWAIHSPVLRDTVCGTPVYSSPQMIKKQPYDSKIDVWSIGVLTYELIYGTIPFEIRRVQDLSKIIQQQIYFSNCDEISVEAKNFISACTNKNAGLRLTIRQAIEHDFLMNMDKNRLTLS